MSAIEIRYRGLTGTGNAVTGTRRVVDLAGFVERRFDRRWAELTVLADAPSGEEIQVGGIHPAPRRGWWADSQVTQ